MTRGELARRGGVNFETIRYYEGRGLIPKAARSAAGYRLYSAETVRRVRFIQRAQDLGFTLREIQELLALRASPRARCGKVYARAEAKVAQIAEKINALRAMRQALRKLMTACAAGERGPSCPILEALEEQGP